MYQILLILIIWNFFIFIQFVKIKNMSCCKGSKKDVAKNATQPTKT